MEVKVRGKARFLLLLLLRCSRYLLFALAGYVSLVGCVMLLLPALEPKLVAEASRQVGVPVHVTDLASGWRGFNPVVYLRGVSVGQTGELQLGELTVEFDLPASIGHLSPRFSVAAKHATVTLVRVDGRWRVAGLPASDKPFNYPTVLQTLDKVDLGLEDISVVMRDMTLERRLVLSSGGLVTEDGERTLQLQVEVDGHTSKAGTLELGGQFAGELQHLDSVSGSFALVVSDLDLGGLLPPVGASQVSTMSTGGLARIDLDRGDARASLSVEIGPIVLTTNGKRSELVLGTVLSASALAVEGEWSLRLDQGEFRFADGLIDLAAAEAGVRQVPGALEVGARLPVIPVGLVADVVAGLRGIIPQRVISLLEDGGASGNLRDVRLWAQVGAMPVPPRVTARFEHVFVRGDRAVPQFENVSGFVSLTGLEGYVEVNTTEPAKVGFAIFKNAWPLDAVKGRVSMTPIEGGGVQISSGLLEMEVGEIFAHGRFVLNAPKDRGEQSWGLEVGVQNARLTEAGPYLPTSLSPAFRQWLQDAVLGGQAPASSMIFHGPPTADTPKEHKTFELLFDVKDLSMRYHPEWPAVDEVEALVFAGNHGAVVHDAVGRLYTSTVHNINVQVPIVHGGGVEQVEVDAELVGPLDDSIRFINETPLAALTNRVTAHWQGSGNITAKGRVRVPIGLAQGLDTEVHADVMVNLEHNDINMPDYNLVIEQTSANLRYSNETGLSAQAFSGRLFDEAVSGTIASDVYGHSGEIRVEVEGLVDAASLHAWSEQPILSQTGGKLEYTSTLHVPFGPGALAPYIVARSELLGMQSRLPAPMDKMADEATRFEYQHTFESGYDIVEWDYAGEVIGRLKVQDGSVIGGEVTFGLGRLLSNDLDRISIYGQLAYADYDAWSALMDAMTKEAGDGIQSEFAAAVGQIEVSVARLEAFGLELDDAGLSISREGEGWKVIVADDRVDGTIRIPDADLPLTVDLNYLRLIPDEDDSLDPLADINPREYLAVDFATAAFWSGEDDYGSWSFRFRPTENGAIFSDVKSTVRGLNVVEDSVIEWQHGADGSTSSFSGVVATDDLAGVIRGFGYASSIEGKGFRYRADFSWPGSPVMIDLPALTGSLAIESGSGRFVQVDSGGAGALKLLGIFDFASLARRFRFDFSDIVRSGYSFSKVTGTVGLEAGGMSVSSPVVIEGSSSIFTIGGSIDLKTEAVDADMIVTLPVSRNLPWYAAYSAIATGPLVGAGVYLAQRVFENQINAMSSAKYKVGGTLDKPDIRFVQIFNDSVREVPAASRVRSVEGQSVDAQPALLDGNGKPLPESERRQ